MSKLRQQFNDYFEEETGWEPSEHPNKQYVADLWDAFQAGHNAWSDDDE
ncbi:hypothetical protein POP15_189 [Pectobacterium phage POP15]|nr:hypothetical protein POP15_189 [Pectobacterium phage POP15]